MNEKSIRIASAIGIVGAFAAWLAYKFRLRPVSAESGAYIASAEVDGEIFIGAPEFKAPTVAPFAPVSQVTTAASMDTTPQIARSTRGLRNKNPGNIRWIANASRRWRGMVANDGTNYGIFESDALGVRAIRKQLDVYASRDELRTVRGIISKWAPPSENITSAYINAVAKALSVGPDTIIDVSAFMPNLVVAIIKHENGVQPYRLADIQEWIEIP